MSAILKATSKSNTPAQAMPPDWCATAVISASGIGKRIRYVQPYSIEARQEPWAADRDLYAATGPPRPPASKSGGPSGLGRRSGDSTLHIAAAEPQNLPANAGIV